MQLDIPFTYSVVGTGVGRRNMTHETFVGTIPAEVPDVSLSDAPTACRWHTDLAGGRMTEEVRYFEGRLWKPLAQEYGRMIGTPMTAVTGESSLIEMARARLDWGPIRWALASLTESDRNEIFNCPMELGTFKEIHHSDFDERSEAALNASHDMLIIDGHLWTASRVPCILASTDSDPYCKELSRHDFHPLNEVFRVDDETEAVSAARAIRNNPETTLQMSIDVDIPEAVHFDADWHNLDTAAGHLVLWQSNYLREASTEILHAWAALRDARQTDGDFWAGSKDDHQERIAGLIEDLGRCSHPNGYARRISDMAMTRWSARSIKIDTFTF